jgi:hypothetical protein
MRAAIEISSPFNHAGHPAADRSFDTRVVVAIYRRVGNPPISLSFRSEGRDMVSDLFGSKPLLSANSPTQNRRFLPFIVHRSEPAYSGYNRSVVPMSLTTSIPFESPKRRIRAAGTTEKNVQIGISL